MSMKNIKRSIIFLMIALLFGCGSKTQKLEREVAWQHRTIEKLEAENKRLMIKLMPTSFVEKARIKKPQQVTDQDIDKAFRIVSTFLKRVDNVDSEDNGEFIGKFVENIDPLDKRRKVELLIYICSTYTPTDYKYYDTACDKLGHYGKALFPGVSQEIIVSNKSPLLGLYEH